MVVEIARQIDDKARLLAVLDDDMQWLDAEVGSVRVCGQLDYGAELYVVLQPSANSRGVLGDCGGVAEGDGGRLRQERQGYPVGDVRLDLVELGLVSAWSAPGTARMRAMCLSQKRCWAAPVTRGTDTEEVEGWDGGDEVMVEEGWEEAVTSGGGGSTVSCTGRSAECAAIAVGRAAASTEGVDAGADP
jgi:hypothetical protein